MRVVTWNLWWRFGPWQERQKAILAVLRELRPDAVGLQEVWQRGGGTGRDGGGGDNLAGWLAGELGMHWAWGEYGDAGRWQRRIGDPDVGIGGAVLSRWPVRERDAIALPAGDGGSTRGALYALLDAPGAPVPFFTAHLSSATDASAVRCRQVTALAGFVARHRGGHAHPPVITGDFNAWPDSDEVRLFGGYRTAPAVPGQCFFDAWEYAEPGAPSATWDLANPYVAGSFGPSVRVDYIHVGPPGPGGLGHVRAVRRAGEGPVGGVWPSDHLAVVADLAGPADSEVASGADGTGPG
ncbi:endonuclease/exonuclease/phosphatase family protein [Streptomyces scabiei]|uniref:endonuclease/exonuclease/phosphatase family protein n=2 Tax=Streptomyces scabiei TaxID=1930 RepID=UPI001B305D7F|nr:MULTISPECIES: endonuclease/exonuclease/phosphatase family protein [Streptomyces]MBP5867969.1 endonuclease [Streptomyces sp. LBUM 1485]MBP5916221.1 endonuclease [Streptomyces sp. LBUM 1486]MDX2538303.1 endonuclease/exonuclease/phosphatase family protein [Streptomyces scabiei]MDX2800912.1 endonuclease/exonuclease/phosphatase family protein [Streptomyces scabiei]MDX3031874.1 endonuclease/exonuclease/phosphatase family protein [Streptomyces scabiei]